MLQNNGTGCFTISRIDRLRKTRKESLILPSVALSVADFDGNGTGDLLVGCHSQNDRRYPFQLLLRQPNNSFEVHLIGSQSTMDSVVADFDGDGDVDALLGNAFGSTDTVWLNQTEKSDEDRVKDTTQAGN